MNDSYVFHPESDYTNELIAEIDRFLVSQGPQGNSSHIQTIAPETESKNLPVSENLLNTLSNGLNALLARGDSMIDQYLEWERGSYYDEQGPTQRKPFPVSQHKDGSYSINMNFAKGLKFFQFDLGLS